MEGDLVWEVFTEVGLELYRRLYTLFGVWRREEVLGWPWFSDFWLDLELAMNFLKRLLGTILPAFLDVWQMFFFDTIFFLFPYF